MLRALAGQAGAAMREAARDAVTRAILVVIALVFLTGAVAFASVALYHYLLTVTGPVLAALGVAGAFLVAALVVLLIALARSRRTHPLAVPPAGASAAGPGAPLASGATGLAGDAEALGILLGRNMQGVPLVLTALAIGILLGRARK